ncbi:hypothetical protein FEM48_Zijuj01G0156800 [Ziziphus jujuba var. spinosa]|uniref:Uncharacterized protein n=1 Tax=Ziziphus jujuba var. spinosa TaxID=714518 RepID=A0A978W239_ZIZJJ|nr:hypothetical protein FEM48_Zijuj01G0156800 [Ziziphus jujuba var. spinosa]
MHPKNQGDKAEAYLNKVIFLLKLKFLFLNKPICLGLLMMLCFGCKVMLLSSFLLNFQTLQMKENEQRNKYLMESHSAMNQQIRPGKFQMDNNCRKMLGQPASSLLAANIYEDEHHRTESASKLDPSLHLLDVNKVNLSKSVATSSSNPLEHMFRMIQQQAMRDNRIGINLEKSVAIDPSLYGLQNAVFQMTGSHDSGLTTSYFLLVMHCYLDFPLTWKNTRVSPETLEAVL